jgi:hypothetical protein
MSHAAGSGAPALCNSCQGSMEAAGPARLISAGICDSCLASLSTANQAKCREILQAIDAPILLMQSDPRQVFTANGRALALFGRELAEAEGHRGGEVFGCVHSFTQDGCGKDAHCDDCKIKAAIVSGFAGAASAASTLTIRTGGGDLPHTLAISAEKAGGHALVRIERFEPQNGGPNE